MQTQSQMHTFIFSQFLSHLKVNSVAHVVYVDSVASALLSTITASVDVANPKRKHNAAFRPALPIAQKEPVTEVLLKQNVLITTKHAH